MILGEMSWPEIEKGLTKTRTVILPVGAVEEHGPHLPVTTDTLQALEVAYEVARKRDVFVAPPVHYGICRSTRGFPGTVSVGFNALRDYVYDILLGFYESNFRYVMVLSGHAGGQHMASLKEACQSAVNDTDLRISLLTDFDLIRCDTPGDGHAGDIETSRMLLHRPDLVRGLPHANYPKRPRHLILRSVREYMGNGIMGDPSRASAEKGVRYFEMAVQGVLEALDELEGFSAE